MIKFEHTEVVGWQHAIRGMRNPMNSWDKTDSEMIRDIDQITGECIGFDCVLGVNDLRLMHKLCKAGSDHRKFMRMIAVYVDITAPRYWWEQMATYKVGVTTNSCSTMHKIHAKEFTLDDFSHEHLMHYAKKEVLEGVIQALNSYRTLFIGEKDKKWWLQMIQLLPQSYNQKRTVMLNYEVLTNIYKSRRNHKLDEWHDFCAWIETLPYSELITGAE